MDEILTITGLASHCRGDTNHDETKQEASNQSGDGCQQGRPPLGVPLLSQVVLIDEAELLDGGRPRSLEIGEALFQPAPDAR